MFFSYPIHKFIFSFIIIYTCTYLPRTWHLLAKQVKVKVILPSYQQWKIPREGIQSNWPLHQCWLLDPYSIICIIVLTIGNTSKQFTLYIYNFAPKQYNSGKKSSLTSCDIKDALHVHLGKNKNTFFILKYIMTFVLCNNISYLGMFTIKFFILYTFNTQQGMI